MRRYQIYIALLLLCFSFSCKKAKELTYFNVSESSEFTIPKATNLPLPGNVATVPVKTNSQFDFSNDKKNTKYIDEVVTQEVKLNITAPEGQNFNFLNSIKIFINAQGQTETLVAYKEVVPQNVSQFSLDMTGTRVDNYLKTDSYTLRVEAVTDEITAKDINIKTDMVFRVRAKIL